MSVALGENSPQLENGFEVLVKEIFSSSEVAPWFKNDIQGLLTLDPVAMQQIYAETGQQIQGKQDLEKQAHDLRSIAQQAMVIAIGVGSSTKITQLETLLGKHSIPQSLDSLVRAVLLSHMVDDQADLFENAFRHAPFLTRLVDGYSLSRIVGVDGRDSQTPDNVLDFEQWSPENIAAYTAQISFEEALLEFTDSPYGDNHGVLRRLDLTMVKKLVSTIPQTYSKPNPNKDIWIPHHHSALLCFMRKYLQIPLNSLIITQHSIYDSPEKQLANQTKVLDLFNQLSYIKRGGNLASYLNSPNYHPGADYRASSMMGFFYPFREHAQGKIMAFNPYLAELYDVFFGMMVGAVNRASETVDEDIKLFSRDSSGVAVEMPPTTVKDYVNILNASLADMLELPDEDHDERMSLQFIAALSVMTHPKSGEHNFANFDIRKTSSTEDFEELIQAFLRLKNTIISRGWAKKAHADFIEKLFNVILDETKL